jgi:hypothetical protein
VRPSSASSARSWPSKPTNGPKAAATSDSRSSPAAGQHSFPTTTPRSELISCPHSPHEPEEGTQRYTTNRDLTPASEAFHWSIEYRRGRRLEDGGSGKEHGGAAPSLDVGHLEDSVTSATVLKSSAVSSTTVLTARFTVSPSVVSARSQPGPSS